VKKRVAAERSAAVEKSDETENGSARVGEV